MPRLGNAYTGYFEQGAGMLSDLSKAIDFVNNVTTSFNNIASKVSRNKRKPSQRTIRNAPRPPRKARRLGRKPFPGPSISSGRFKRMRRIKHKGRAVKVARGGCWKVVEHGGESTGTEIIYMGHGTCPPLQVWEMIASALVKTLAVQMKLEIPDMYTQVPFCQVGDAWAIRYKPNWEAAESEHIYTATAAYTYEEVAEDFKTWLAGNWTTQYVLVAINFNGATNNPAGSIYLNMRNTQVTLSCKSSYKLQNRSVGQSGDEDANDVDNVPLHGKSYFGRGSGTQYNSGTTGIQPFVIDATTGTFDFEPSFDSLKDPAPPYLFAGTIKAGKAHLDPGHIKTSVLTFNRRMLLSTLMRANSCLPYTGSAQNSRLGVFKFFALEKMIDIGADEVIKIAYEHNLRIGCSLTYKRMTYTSQKFEKL